MEYTLFSKLLETSWLVLTEQGKMIVFELSFQGTPIQNHLTAGLFLFVIINLELKHKTQNNTIWLVLVISLFVLGKLTSLFLFFHYYFFI